MTGAGRGGQRYGLPTPAKGYSIHLGGPWYFTSSPDTGRLYFAKDHGTGTHEVPSSVVPPEKRAKVGR